MTHGQKTIKLHCVSAQRDTLSKSYSTEVAERYLMVGEDGGSEGFFLLSDVLFPSNPLLSLSGTPKDISLMELTSG
jgi:hypothetical protein